MCPRYAARCRRRYAADLLAAPSPSLCSWDPLRADLVARLGLAALPSQLLSGLANGLLIGTIFTVGHDAGHDSLTPSTQAQSGAGPGGFPAIIDALHHLGIRP